MSAEIIDGSAVAKQLLAETAARAKAFTERAGRAPCLATVLVGQDPASMSYVRMKQNRSAKNGIDSRKVELPETTTTDELIAAITGLSDDPQVDGILLQHPVPEQIDERAAFEAIAPRKDVDGVTMHSLAATALDLPSFHSCTPEGIVRLLDSYRVELAGKRAVVIGRSPILGMPVGLLLLGRNATVTYCHSGTVDLADQVRQADVVVAAVGRPELIKGEWIKPGAVVVDAGYNPGNVGDVEQAVAVERASMITPVPGGVGPMTIAVLLAQTVAAAEASLG
ncbi:bifunctional 5,10-methylenetetrahydrofolate dehydrogenase/5,10-methenyltetrahydrofolate cyclohydrolase [Microlunatus soli]|uniref:Bifunctional protein FolD n=1 Tax=Microlunatus soli TaxID=630515 RepID=A0A1H2ALR7_9ACTN|nr:bifunctional 5,10-methylenetetrahydrofolate dehydrogenase/5,10-methenyltetrahydrofolate cyclohydrolase [Microlunatus soli]SDT46794.1 methenyltetrahydrofolate cyclohydrolase /5,10-methylenetetrahydrofolate dehydrogenase (NADP+) [Microlunatus soli]